LGPGSGTSASAAAETLRGAAIIAAIKRAGIEFVVALPDIVTSDGLLWPLSTDRDVKLVRICKEDEGVAICAGLSFCDRKSLLLIQNTGLFDSLNAVRAVGAEYELPICMMVGLQGKEPDLLPRQSSKYAVRIVEPVLDAMEIEHHLLQDPTDVAKIEPAIARAYSASKPVVLLVGRSPAAS